MNDYFSKQYKGVANPHAVTKECVGLHPHSVTWDPTAILMTQMHDNPIYFTDLSNDEKVCWIYKFHLDLEFLRIAGWAMHTCDWDPFIVVTLNDGEVWESASGYYDIEILGLKRSSDDDLVELMEAQSLIGLKAALAQDDLTFKYTREVIIRIRSCKDTSDHEFTRDFPLSTLKSITVIDQ